jgi:hypothetical protein
MCALDAKRLSTISGGASGVRAGDLGDGREGRENDRRCTDAGRKRANEARTRHQELAGLTVVGTMIGRGVASLNRQFSRRTGRTTCAMPESDGKY